MVTCVCTTDSQTTYSHSHVIILYVTILYCHNTARQNTARHNMAHINTARINAVKANNELQHAAVSMYDARGRGATGSIDPPLFQVRGPHMALDPTLFVRFFPEPTCQP